MAKTIPQFLIAAPTSGSGKTTVSRGLMALLARKGMTVQPFKCGPDYIDTKYHSAVCSRPSINLDTFMASSGHVRGLYAHYVQDADVAIVEGMMGMFDGYERDRGSSADVAKLLNIPVVLVVNARSAAYSMAPLLSGFIHFRPELRIAGIIFNCVGSPRHYSMLKEVCEDLHVPCLGYLPKRQELEQASRHLGLDFSRSHETDALDPLVSLLEEHVDWHLLLQQTQQPLPETIQTVWRQEVSGQEKKERHILIARNEESFSFLYEEHVEILRRMGTISFFNPEHDYPIPSDTDLLYLPGGYPEERLEQLAAAHHTLNSIRRYIEDGGKTLAECGGMIYLSQGVTYDLPQQTDEPEKRVVPLLGIFPFGISNEKNHRKLSLGYRQFNYQDLHLRGHEFHYTTFNTQPPSSIAQVYNARGQMVGTPVFRYKNTIASYTHLYWGETDIMDLF